MDTGVVVGLGALGFWLFIASTVIGGIWDGIRKRETQQETLRRMLESGKEIDPDVMDALLDRNKRPDRDLKLASYIVFGAAVGLLLLGVFIGLHDSDALMPIMGVSALVASVGFGLRIAARFLERSLEEDRAANRLTLD